MLLLLATIGSSHDCHGFLSSMADASDNRLGQQSQALSSPVLARTTTTTIGFQKTGAAATFLETSPTKAADTPTRLGFGRQQGSSASEATTATRQQQQQTQEQHRRRLPGGMAIDDDLIMALLALILVLMILSFLWSCFCSCCCYRRQRYYYSNGGGGGRGCCGGGCGSCLCDCLAILCLWEICCPQQDIIGPACGDPCFVLV